MTVATTRGTKLTHDQMVLAAYKLAGLLDASATTSDPQVSNMLSTGRTLLDIILDQLSVNPNARNVDFYELAMVADQQQYTLAEEIIDVVDDGYYTAAGVTPDSSQTGTIVTQITRDRWQLLTSRDSSSTPTLMYAHRGVENSYQIVLYVWPRPEEAGTITLQVQRAPADATTGSATLDLKSAWNAYVLHELAAKLAMPTYPNRAQLLMVQAAQYKREANNFAASHAPITMEMGLQAAQKRGR